MNITKTRLFKYKYIENFIAKKVKYSDKTKSDIFHISAQNIDCGCSLEALNPSGFKGVKIIQACFRDGVAFSEQPH